ncbi:MAG TPA: hypothetical protein DCE44_02400, partial [Verrucomicrobiales bacterium]|nr:hypothetical protein [Verrucomicrobiales bacterium]
RNRPRYALASEITVAIPSAHRSDIAGKDRIGEQSGRVPVGFRGNNLSLVEPKLWVLRDGSGDQFLNGHGLGRWNDVLGSGYLPNRCGKTDCKVEK